LVEDLQEVQIKGAEEGWCDDGETGVVWAPRAAIPEDARHWDCCLGHKFLV